jgi:hypothetical protein
MNGTEFPRGPSPRLQIRAWNCTWLWTPVTLVPFGASRPSERHRAFFFFHRLLLFFIFLSRIWHWYSEKKLAEVELSVFYLDMGGTVEFAIAVS